jgi:hypothetical protein
MLLAETCASRDWSLHDKKSKAMLMIMEQKQMGDTEFVTPSSQQQFMTAVLLRPPNFAILPRSILDSTTITTAHGSYGSNFITQLGL